MPGYSTEMKQDSLDKWEYPTGSEWQKLFESGKFKREYWRLRSPVTFEKISLIVDEEVQS